MCSRDGCFIIQGKWNEKNNIVSDMWLVSKDILTKDSSHILNFDKRFHYKKEGKHKTLRALNLGRSDPTLFLLFFFSFLGEDGKFFQSNLPPFAVEWYGKKLPETGKGEGLWRSPVWLYLGTKELFSLWSELENMINVVGSYFFFFFHGTNVDWHILIKNGFRHFFFFFWSGEKYADILMGVNFFF